MYETSEPRFYSLENRIEEDLPIDRDLPGEEPNPNFPDPDQPGERLPNEEEPMPDRDRPNHPEEDLPNEELPDADPDEPGRPNIPNPKEAPKGWSQSRRRAVLFGV